MVTQTYRSAAWELLEQGVAELEAGDVRQASEKGWGAAAQIVKAAGELRGWRHNTHGALFTVINRLARETGNNDIRHLFSEANSLHANFYENWMDADYVEEELRQMRKLLELLQPLTE